MKPRIILCTFLSSLLWGTLFSGPIARLDRYASGLGRLSDIESARDQSGRLFAAELSGRVRIVRDKELLETPFLDISDKVSELGEGGLIGITFHPGYAQNGRFFVTYTSGPEEDFKMVIAEYRVSEEDPDRAATQERIILEIEQPTVVHQAGGFAFGPDGMLYISSGDGGPGLRPGNQAQELDNLLGKILRIDVEQTDQPYRIPPDNPFVAQEEARDEIWAYGFRNPFRLGFDPLSGRLFLGDVGDDSFEEVNLIQKGGNYGWPRLEGNACFPPQTLECDREGLVAPIHAYGREDGGSAIGGLVYRGPQLTSLFGAYIFGDFISGRIWALEETSRDVWQRRLLARLRFPVAFAQDEDGVIFVAENGGTIFRIAFIWREIFAQVADGATPVGRFQSSFLVANNGREAAQGELFFVATDGTQHPVTINGNTALSFRFRIAAKSTRIFRTDQSSEPFFSGWAAIFSESPVSGTIILSLGEGDRVAAEAGSQASALGREFVAAVNRSAAGTDSALAVVNPSVDTALTLRLSLQDGAGEEVAFLELDLGPLQRRALFINEIGPLPLDFQGTLVARSDREFAATILQTFGGVQSAGR